MIVADVNLIVYFLIGGLFTEEAKGVFDRDPNWVAPTIWHSELLNVLSTSGATGSDYHK